MIRFFFVLVVPLAMVSCAATKNANSMDGKTILEITTFHLSSTANPGTFAKRDAQVEKAFTSKQPGFLKRQSGVDDNGSYVVMVYWESLADADASMSKFMGDAAVADYAQMIDASTMQMSRFANLDHANVKVCNG